MSIGQIIAQLTDVKRSLQELPPGGAAPAQTLREAAALADSVLQGLPDKRIADDIRKQAEVVTAAFARGNAAVPHIDATIAAWHQTGRF